MAIYLGIGEHQLQELDEAPQAVLLPRSPRVGRLAVSVEAAYVADADAVCIMVLTVASRVLQGFANLDAATQVDDVVIAAVRSTRQREASLLVPSLNVIQLEITPLLRRGAMQDDFLDFSHNTL